MTLSVAGLEGKAVIKLNGEAVHLGRGSVVAVTEPSARRSARAVN